MRPLTFLTVALLFLTQSHSLAANDVIESSADRSEQTTRATASEIQPLPAPQLPSAEALAVILERPLFFESRRPGSGAPVATTNSPPPISLKGIIFEDDQKRAIFSQEDEGRTLQLTQGMSHNGWSLVKIMDSHVDLQRGPELIRFTLNYKSPKRLSVAAQNDSAQDREDSERQHQEETVAAMPESAGQDPDLEEQTLEEIEHDIKNDH